MIKKTKYTDIRPYTTKDGSLIRELMHPDVHGNLGQSLAEAVVPVGSMTFPHRHLSSEEIYHIVEGKGLMSMADEQCDVSAGDTVHIPSGTIHKIQNTGTTPLKLLCCCSPAYSHDDTEVLP